MNDHMTPSLEQNKQAIIDLISSADLKMHELAFGKDSGLRGSAIFIDGLISQSFMSAALLRPLSITEIAKMPSGMDVFSQSILNSGETSIAKTFDECARGLFEGSILLLCEGMPEGLLLSAKGWEKRGVTDPQTESVIRGPREAFTENLRTNTALIRRRIKTTGLHVEEQVIGRRSKTSIALMYIEDIVNKSVLELLKERLAKVDVDSILDAGSLEQYIEDAPFSIFPLTGFSEKPDVVAANMLEGRIAIVVEGSPFVLTVPMLFVENFQSSEDYYSRTVFSSISRFLRFSSFLLAVLGPAVYIALTTFHQELIPPPLLLTIAKARENIPFPAFIEAIIMVLAFELLREAGLRLPRLVGQAMSIVGALIMGEAAVRAGIVGEPMIITVAITAVCGFTVPWLNDAIFVLKFVSMIAAACLGNFGIAVVALGTMAYLSSARSYGVRYLSGIAPSDIESKKDLLIRAPLWSMRTRPVWTTGRDLTRRGRRPKSK